MSEYVDTIRLGSETDSTDGFRFGAKSANASDNMTVAIDLVNAGGNKWIVSPELDPVAQSMSSHGW